MRGRRISWQSYRKIATHLVYILLSLLWTGSAGNGYENQNHLLGIGTTFPLSLLPSIITSSTRRVRILQWACLSLCLSAHISETTRPNFTKFSMHVGCGRGSVLLWRRCDMFCFSGFVDDITFSHNGRMARHSCVFSCGDRIRQA